MKSGRSFRLLFLSLLALTLPERLHAQPFLNTVIAIENQQSGTSAWLLSQPATHNEIEGYASLCSVNVGGAINLFVNTTNSSYSLEVYRVGWYGGVGGRLMFGPVVVPSGRQPMPVADPTNHLVECAWTNPFTLNIPAPTGGPADWVSGVYLGKLTGSQDGKQTYIIFVVRDDARPTDLLAQSSFNTYQAYNIWGGWSLYGNTLSLPSRAVKVSFNRPYIMYPGPAAAFTRGSGEFFTLSTGLASWECNFVRWLEREGYDVSYCTGVDVHANTNLLANHKAFISMGHDEYWSYPMRWNVTASRDRGVNLAFLGGNDCSWQVRFEPSLVDGTPNRTMVCYKSTADPVFSTTSNQFTTVGFSSPPVSNPQASLLGVSYVSWPVYSDLVVLDATHWIFASAEVKAGQLLPGLLGYEVDSTNMFSPPGTRVACASPFIIDRPPLKFSGTSHAASYVAPSGATVFCSGTMQWPWGLDDLNTPGLRESFLNPTVQTATRNILARLANRPVPSPTLLVRSDGTTAGDWKSRYSAEGFLLPNDATNLPPYATLNSDALTTPIFLASSSDPNALQRSASTNRYLSGWSSPTNFTLSLNCADTNNHQVAIYCWDWDHSGRQQRIDVLDATGTNLLDSRVLANFSSGQWWVWQVRGPVQFRFTNLAGPDCLANAIVFGSGGAAVSLPSDLTTQGNWPAAYGTQGAFVAGGAALGFSGNPIESAYNTNLVFWSLDTADARALAPTAGPYHWLAAWTTPQSMSFALNLADGAWHQLAIYCLDPDALGRTQMVSLVDAGNNTVLDSQLLSNFSAGKYIRWNVRGAVKIRFQRMGPSSAAVSGIFLDPPDATPAVSLVQPPNLEAFTLPTNVVLTVQASGSTEAVSQVNYYADGNLLSSVAAASLSFTWTNPPPGQHVLFAVAQDSRQFWSTSAPVSITVSLPAGYLPPQVQITSPADGTTLQAGTNITCSTAVTTGSVPVVSLQFLLDGTALGPALTQPPYSQATGSLFTGTHQLCAIATDTDGVTVASATNHVTVSAPQAFALFHGYDWSAQGSWPGLYGGDGQVIINYATNVPAYAAASLTGGSSLTWASSTGDPRALLEPVSQVRFAAVWYSSSTETLDLNLLDGGPHRISMYCLDWTNQGSAQTIQVVDGLSGVLLDSRTATNFSKGVYLSWRVAGHVQFKIVCNSALAPAMVTGVFFDPPFSVPAASILTPARGTCYPQGSNVTASVIAVGVTTNLSAVQLLANGSVVGSTNSESPFLFTWTNPSPGDDVLIARVVDANGSVGYSAPVSITVERTAAAATFRSADYGRQGSWSGTFGRQGFAIAGVTNNLPGYVQLQNSSQMITWANSTTDPRALQSGSGSSRAAAAWYAFTNLVLDVKFSDTAFHRVALYFMDWPNFGANQTLSVLDFGTGAPLDTRVLAASTLVSGVWVVWDVKGDVRFLFNRWGNAPALLNGIFFDPSTILSPILISSPATGSVFTVPTNISLAATAASDPNVVHVDFYAGTTLLGSSSNGPPFNLTWTNPPLGIWTLFAREVGLLSTTDSPPVQVSVISSNGAPISLSAALQAQGVLRLDMVSPVTATVRVEAATNLRPGAAWVPLLTNSIGPSPISVFLDDSTNYPVRFYRLVPLP